MVAAQTAQQRQAVARAILEGHREIGNEQIAWLVRKQAQQLAATVRLSHHIQIAETSQQGTDAQHYDGMVIGDDDPGYLAIRGHSLIRKDSLAGGKNRTARDRILPKAHE
ncbi:hypothetical protein GCM10011408_03230 [Dyella caseinilytica]|nr:hypothetical protein GCM10011408_03230 [Dyella caseinilytica]